MSDERNVFRFDLNESLYFEKGQEVSEMIGISLDPEISIQSYDDYVSIRGVIELVGEYRKTPSNWNESEEDTLYFNDNHSKRFIENVEDTVEDRAIFSHRFPVEISVPAYRIQDINDVTVSIESFDYELPSSDQLTIKSKVDIYGIHDESPALRTQDEELWDNEGNLDDTFEFDVKEQQETEKEEAERTTEFEVSGDQLQATEAPKVVETSQAERSEAEESEEDGRWKTKTQTFDEFFGKETEAEAKLEEVQEEENDEDVYVSDDEYMEHDDYYEDEEEILRDIHYLASMFRNKEDDTEQAKYTQVRLCIVQHDDTLEKIAKRYKVTTMQLLKKNALESDNLNEGQLLYIPSKNTTLDFE